MKISKVYKDHPDYDYPLSKRCLFGFHDPFPIGWGIARCHSCKQIIQYSLADIWETTWQQKK